VARIQHHHITYDPEWEVELTMQMHRCISRIQNTKATPEQYARVINFLHSVSFEANRMRCELDICKDCRVVSTVKKKSKKKGVKKRRVGRRRRVMVKRIKGGKRDR